MENDLEALPERLAVVRGRIADAARRANRDPDSVTLIAVSKGKSAEAIRTALQAGLTDIGESYAQELEDKAKELAGEILSPRFHFIGQLQRNKVAKAVVIAQTIHAVDRVDLAREIDKRASAARITVRILIEVNISGEASKAGCLPADLGPLLDVARPMKSIEVAGLMTIPPEVANPEDSRKHFAALRELRDRHGASSLPELSMGMSHDFEIAIEEGATMVRIGTAIFGARKPG